MSKEQEFIERLVIVQESGTQLFCGRYEKLIHCFVPFDDEEFGKQYCAELNRKTDLPFYLAKVQIKLISSLEKWTDEMLQENGIALLPNKT